MQATRARAWAGRNFVPLVLLPLAVVLLWVAIWRVWLPPTGEAGAVTRMATTVTADTATKPTHKVTTVVKSTRSSPSRRSEVLALALLFIGAGAAVIAVFHDRIGSLELDKDGVKIELTPEEQSGAAELVGRLASSGVGAAAYARGIGRYVRAVAGRRPAAQPASPLAGAAAPAGLSSEQAAALAERIADGIV